MFDMTLNENELKKINLFKLYLPLVSDILVLNSRRIIRNIIPKKRTIDIIAVDVDGTICDGFTGYDLAIELYGKEKAEIEEKEFRERLSKGRTTIEEELIYEIEKAYKDGLREKDIENLIEKYEKDGKIRIELIEILKELKERKKHILVITKGLEYTAKYIAKKYGFDEGYGTKIKSGKVIELIGIRKKWKNGVKIVTKLDKVKEFCEEQGIKFDRKKVAIITDDIFDSKEMRKSGMGILYIPENPIIFQKGASSLGLWDVKIKKENCKVLKNILI